MGLRRFKPAYSIYNFFKKKELAHNIPLFKKHGIKKRYFSPICAADFNGIHSEPNKYDRFDSKTELPRDPSFISIEEKYRSCLLDWSQNGFAILPEFFSTNEVEEINCEVSRLIESNQANWRYRNKIMFAIHNSQLLHQIGTGKRLVGILELLMTKEIELFQSINFETASEQRTHSDAYHMSTFPQGNLIAVWIALEDMTLKNGALHYYPKSHKLPYIMNHDFGNKSSAFLLGPKEYSDYEDKIKALIQESELKKEVFIANKGDVLIWHANLLHGGEPLLDRTLGRKSMVFHYYAKDAICFHEITERPTLKREVVF